MQNNEVGRRDDEPGFWKNLLASGRRHKRKGVPFLPVRHKERRWPSEFHGQVVSEATSPSIVMVKTGERVNLSPITQDFSGIVATPPISDVTTSPISSVLTILGKMIKIDKKDEGVNMKATATEVKNKFGKFSDIARNEPVIVEKTGRKAIVLVAFEEYERLTQIEDAYWAEKAARAEADGYVGSEESMAFISGKHA